MNRILSIEKGAGERSTYFAVNDKYKYAILGDRIHRIEEEMKTIGAGLYNDLTIVIYNGYDIKGQLLFSIEANSSLTIIYESNLLTTPTGG